MAGPGRGEGGESLPLDAHACHATFKIQICDHHSSHVEYCSGVYILAIFPEYRPLEKKNFKSELKKN